MSCGTSFSCGVHRFDKYKFPQHDKPANKVLHHENEKRLHDLMKLREQQDHGIFQSVTLQPVILQPVTTEKQDTTLLHYDHGSVLYYSVSDSKIKQD
jgi:hypothetical protein